MTGRRYGAAIWPKERKRRFVKRCLEVCEAYGTTPTEFAKEAGVSYATLLKWIKDPDLAPPNK